MVNCTSLLAAGPHYTGSYADMFATRSFVIIASIASVSLLLTFFKRVNDITNLWRWTPKALPPLWGKVAAAAGVP
jgi:hypothetical protein